MAEFAGVFLYVFRSSRTRPSPHVVRRRRGDGSRGVPRRSMSRSPHREQQIGRLRCHLVVGSPRGRGGGRRSPFFALYYVDDGIYVEVQWWPDGRCCRRESASLASDHYQLFGVRSSRDPSLLAPHKISLWDTRLCVLGWDIDTIAMTISVPLEKL